MEFELKSKQNELSIYSKKSTSEIKDLKAQNKELTDEVSNLLNYKSRYEQMKSENNKLLEVEETYEAQIEELQDALTELQFSKANSFGNSKEEIQKYSNRILSLETKLQQKEQELREERVDTEIKLKKELRIIEEGYER